MKIPDTPFQISNDPFHTTRIRNSSYMWQKSKSLKPLKSIQLWPWELKLAAFERCGCCFLKQNFFKYMHFPARCEWIPLLNGRVFSEAIWMDLMCFGQYAEYASMKLKRFSRKGFQNNSWLKLHKSASHKNFKLSTLYKSLRLNLGI